MSGISIFNAKTVADLRALALDGFATRAAVRGTIPLTLWREGNDGTASALPPQDVLMTFADRQPGQPGGGGALVTATEGVFEREEPFDVRVGDWFRLPDGGRGAITVVPFPARGLQRAAFSVAAGRV